MPHSAAGVHVDEVVVEAVVAGDAARLGPLLHRQQRAERGQRPLRRLRARDVAALRADSIRGEAEADGGDAGEGRRRRAVWDQQRLFVGKLPKEIERAALDVVEESVVALRDARAGNEERRQQ